MQEKQPGQFEGATTLVTGATSGIGLEIARRLVRGGARLILPARNRAKGERAVQQIRRDVPRAQIRLVDLDLARLRSVDALVEDLLARDEPIHGLVLNAGMVNLANRARTVTEDGFEIAFQTNLVGHAALVLGLLPRLKRDGTRVVLQGSLAAAGARMPWSDLQGAARYRPFRAYRTSKLALGLFALELARRSAANGWGITVGLCHPGVSPGSGIAPDLRSRLPRGFVRAVTRYVGNPPETAAETALTALESSVERDTRMVVPGGFLQLAGSPRETDPFRSLRRSGDARMIWELLDDWARLSRRDEHDRI